MSTATAAPTLRGTLDGAPVYETFRGVPDGLMTRRQLGSKGLAPRRNQKPAAYAHWYYYGEEGTAALYAVTDARPKRKCSPKQLAALAHGRFVRDACLCYDCGKLVLPASTIHTRGRATATCHTCYDLRAAGHVADTDLEAWAPCLPETLPHMLPGVRLGPQEWAAALLASQDVVVLDSESSDLHRWVVELAVCHADGKPVFSSLVDPRAPLAAGAVNVHGITSDMLDGAPDFSGVLGALGDAVHGRTVVVYNALYDLGCLARELARHARERIGLAGAEVDVYVRTWLGRARWVDLMEPYAEWFGAWSSWHGSYTWQKLPYGDHRAQADAEGAARLLRELANGTAPRLPAELRDFGDDDGDFERW